MALQAPIKSTFLSGISNQLSSVWARFFTDVARAANNGGSLNAPTGIILSRPSSDSIAGWVQLDDGTIGNAASGATSRAAQDTLDLYVLLYNNSTNAVLPVSGGRGSSAAADFAAGKTIALPKVLGRAIGIAGTASGLTTRTLYETVGEQTHLLTQAEGGINAHDHTDSTGHSHNVDDITSTINVGVGGSGAGILEYKVSRSPTVLTSLQSSNIRTDIHEASTTVSGSTGEDADTAHNNLQPTNYTYFFIKL